MKLPLKYIAILVILSLAGIFSYQAYWLGGLYRTMRNDLERNIIEAMRMSDYNEMMLRVERMRKDSTDHGEVSVSAGFEVFTMILMLKSLSHQKTLKKSRLR